MIVDLPVAHADVERASARASQRDVTGLRGVLSLAGAHAAAAPECEWRLALALALNQMSSGSSLVIRDACGRDWYIAPASQGVARSLGKAA